MTNICAEENNAVKDRLAVRKKQGTQMSRSDLGTVTHEWHAQTFHQAVTPGRKGVHHRQEKGAD